ncbi:hypothetical protein [Erythrobacter alti]|uniref:hypothetical protein n=1 Tax=Erythrobacter alti TaxID=1896145 RepID=UPI0030F3EE1E
MEQLSVSFCVEGGTQQHSLQVPDIATALVVAQINADSGNAELREGERLVARLEKRGPRQMPFWRVG